MKYVSCVALLILVLGLGTINFQHHLNLPPNIVNTIEVHNRVGLSGPYKVIDIWLSSEIKDPAKYRDVLQVLNNADSDDVIRFHLGGVGGRGDSMQQIISAIKVSRATTIMLVEASVFSAHAYIAVSGNQLVMSPHTMLMFHATSFKHAEDELCAKMAGKRDRGQDARLKCIDELSHMNALDDELINALPLLTSEEKQQINAGWDVFITDTEFNKRNQK